VSGSGRQRVTYKSIPRRLCLERVRVAPEIHPSLHPHDRQGHPARRDWTKRLASLAEALACIRCTSAVIDGELVFPAADGRRDFYRLQSAMDPNRQHDLAVFAFDLLHHNGEELSPLPLSDRRLQLSEIVARSNVPCMHLVWGFDDGAKLLKVAERHGLEGIVSKRQASAYRSGPSRDWVKIKTAGWRAANRERWRLFER
jgi:ATP-dependent DNA ligase